MAIRAVFFDIGDTLLFDDPPLRERFETAMRQAEIAYPEGDLATAFRARNTRSHGTWTGCRLTIPR